MATVTPGYTFTNDEVVTPTKLNSAATPVVSNIVTADIVDANVTTAKIADANVTTAKIADANVTTAKIADANVTTAKLAALTQQALLPAGAIMPFARTTAPSGWLIADGSVVPNGNGTVQTVTADYTALYAAVGANFGVVGTLPDLRGIFVRGSGPQTISGTVYTGTFGQKQQDQLKAHTHTETNYTFGTAGMQGANAANINSATAGYPATGPALTSGPGSTLVGTETRPANISLLYCIKI